MRSSFRSFAATCLVAVTVLGASGAYAQYDDEEIGGYAVVIQNRKFNMGHEFTLQAGTLPLDAFYKGATGTFRYTLHFNDFHAWEIGSVSYSYNIDTDLRRQLIENFGVQPDARGLEQIFGFLETNYIMKPIYGKLSLFNRLLIYNEIYFNGGFAVAGVGEFPNVAFWPGPGYGAGIRFFLFESLSIRFDMRHYILFNGIPYLDLILPADNPLADPNARLENLVYLGAAVSFNFPIFLWLD